MSASAEDEARARLEVAQLYEDMGQNEKAVRYLAGAADILRGGGLMGRAREVYQRILGLDPANQAAKTALNNMAGVAGGAPSPPPPPKPQAPPPTAAAPAPVPGPPPTRADGKAGVMVPTPLLHRDVQTIMAVRSQVTGPPDFAIFPYDPLPRVDPEVLAARAEARRKQEEAVRRKADPRASQNTFGGQGEGFARPKPAAQPQMPPQHPGPVPHGPPGGVPYGAPPPGRGGQPYYPQQPVYRAPPSGEIRGGNRELAHKIARRISEADKKTQR